MEGKANDSKDSKGKNKSKSYFDFIQAIHKYQILLMEQIYIIKTNQIVLQVKK